MTPSISHHFKTSHACFPAGTAVFDDFVIARRHAPTNISSCAVEAVRSRKDSREPVTRTIQEVSYVRVPARYPL
ncbi:hypothetical protein ACTMQ2_26570 [Pseudomonas syringae pv. aptata]|uniref:hypothetical protein n=1 Tax=Pseudomonas syringae TaxID=317 RepID=UPI001BDCE5A4|nr:hypothetical protein [Pseudomonas syringae]MCK0550903.1 hypothetical protein [Pseudomonas syringae pv. aptata]